MANERVGTINYKELPPLDEQTLDIMGEELKVSVSLTIVYYLFLITVTILNWTAPDFMKIILWGGMTVTWFATSLISLFMAAFIAFL
ncbi:MAG: hypothetical protein HGB17_08000, partial [Syntrophobacteraceae bacterium]|nr:hypothetical protein [Syntrophobacteraceae bacterium]